MSGPADTPSTEILDALATGVLLVDADGHIDFVNAAAEVLLKSSRARLRGRRLADIVHDWETLEAVWRRSGTERNTIVHREFRVRPVAQPNFTLSVDVVASPYADGCVLLELHDTELQLRVERESRLSAQHGAGRTMARQLAHEIKNPLGGLRGAAQLLARRLDDPSLTDFTDVIIREADRLVTLVDTMLGPTGPCRYAPVNVHRLIDRVKRLLDGEAPAGVTLVEDYDPSLPQITLDSDRVIQALLNIARNAMQAVGETGRVTLRTRAVTGFTIGDERHALTLRIDIEDTGPGVDPELREKMFYPLVTSRPDGTGLGLTVAQDLIHRHRGLVQLTGSEPTVFSIFLPYLRSPGDAGEPAS